MKQKIMIADDDANICNLLKSQLISDGYEVLSFLDGESLLNSFKQSGSDLVITDIMMPKLNGYELCKEIRKSSDVPIIMISAKDEEIDRVLGLELGSDDYISKPFSLREVSIKVKNMLKRREKIDKKSSDSITCKDLEVNKKNRTVKICDQQFNTTAKEYDLLEFLVINKNQAFSREKLIEEVWGYDYIGDSRQVDHLIKRLRKKMIMLDCDFKIETLWGFGYKVSDYEN